MPADVQFRPGYDGPSSAWARPLGRTAWERLAGSPRQECLYAFLLLSCRLAFYRGPIPPTRTSPPFGRGPTLPKPVPTLRSYQGRPDNQRIVHKNHHSFTSRILTCLLTPLRRLNETG